MPAISYDLSIEQGAKYTKRFLWKDVNGNPVNLTGYSARMQIRPTVTNPTILLELTTDNGRILLGGAAGTIDLNIGSTITDSLTRGGVYDLELYLTADPDSAIRFAEGSVEVSKEVTR